MQLQRMNRLAPLSEEPIDEQDGRTGNRNRSGSGSGGGGSGGGGGGGRSWRNWIRTHLSILSCGKKSDGLNVLLSVLGCPLFPVSVQPNNFVSSANQVSDISLPLSVSVWEENKLGKQKQTSLSWVSFLAWVVGDLYF